LLELGGEGTEIGVPSAQEHLSASRNNIRIKKGRVKRDSTDGVIQEESRIFNTHIAFQQLLLPMR
jgi:hypothetical protein